MKKSLLFIRKSDTTAFCVDIIEGIGLLRNPKFQDIIDDRDGMNEFWISEDDTGKLYIEDIDMELEIKHDSYEYVCEEDEEDDYPPLWWEFDE